MTYERINEQHYEVRSDSGKQYNITIDHSFDRELDPEYVNLWQCDCPAGQFSRECKHLKIFVEKFRPAERIEAEESEL